MVVQQDASGVCGEMNGIAQTFVMRVIIDKRSEVN
jgi:hypothetical protein